MVTSDDVRTTDTSNGRRVLATGAARVVVSHDAGRVIVVMLMLPFTIMLSVLLAILAALPRPIAGRIGPVARFSLATVGAKALSTQSGSKRRLRLEGFHRSRLATPKASQHCARLLALLLVLGLEAFVSGLVAFVPLVRVAGLVLAGAFAVNIGAVGVVSPPLLGYAFGVLGAVFLLVLSHTRLAPLHMAGLFTAAGVKLSDGLVLVAPGTDRHTPSLKRISLDTCQSVLVEGCARNGRYPG
jgi:hypothetical protein